MTTLPPYPAYKPSGIEWLGDVPAHWQVRRLKDWVSINREALPETTNPDYEFHYLEIGAVGTGSLLDEPVRIRFSNAPSRARRIVRSGDTIISTVRTYLKAVWFADETDDYLICSTGFAVLTPRKGTAPKFVSYLVQSDSFTDRVTADSVGIAYPAISEGRLGSFRVAVPPLAEQAAIARYLDGADARIRRAISAKQRLIELLSEQRQAVIHRAVTRGLDPDAPLKPSGIEWLGDVPAHWQVRRLKTACRFAYGDTLTAEMRNDGDVPVYGSNGQVGVHSEANTLSPCIVIGRKGSFGKVNYVDESAFAIDTTYFVDKRYSQNNLRWLFYVLGCIRLDDVTKDSAIPGLGRGDAYQRMIPLPPLAEQAAIARYLDKATADIDAAIANAQRLIDLLREYRTRLIADAVTGQLDVRGAG